MINQPSETEQLDSFPDTVLLDQSNFDTDIHEFIKQLVLDGIEPKMFKFRLVSWVAASPDSTTKRNRKKEVISYLNIGKRTLERWLETHFSKGNNAIPESPRRGKGKQKVTRDWEQFITETWEQGNAKGQEMTPADVAGLVEREAIENLGVDKYPSYWTILRILRPLIEERRIREGVYSAGQGSQDIVRTSKGKVIKANYPLKLVHADHSLIDVFSIFEDEEEVLYVQEVKNRKSAPEPGTIRLWLTVIKDAKSKCMLSHLLSAKQPNSNTVKLAIKRAICPKFFPSDYGLKDVGIPYGTFRYLITDRGKDLDSNHVKDIGLALEDIGPKVGFTRQSRESVEQGGDVESVFNGLNKRVLSKLPGYTYSNVTKRVKGAEKRACLTPRMIDKIFSWYFYGEYNQECPRGKIRTRYEEFLFGLKGKLPAVIDQRRLDICLMKVVQCKVYKHGTIQFKTRLYRSEILKGYEGRTVTMRYDPDNILHVHVFEQETDQKTGTYLGVANMLNVAELNKLILELKLDMRLIDLKNLEAEVVSLEELQEINQAKCESRQKANESTKATRAKYRGKRYDLVKGVKENPKKQKVSKVQKELHSVANASTSSPKPENTATKHKEKGSRSKTTDNITDQESQNKDTEFASVSSDRNQSQKDQITYDASESKVIDLGAKREERIFQFFAERLKSQNSNID